MALRDKLVVRVSERLEPGEEVRQVFMAQSGPSPYWIFLTYLTMFWNRYLIVAVTDRSIVTLRATAFRPSFVKKPAQLNRYDRNMRFGPCSGLWSKVVIDDTNFHVHWRFFSDIRAADAEVEKLVAPPGWYDDPEGGVGQRYWDGTIWTEDRS